MTDFGLLVNLLAYEAGEKQESELAHLLQNASAESIKSIVCLATGRVGPSYAPRIPWIGMTSQRLEARFQGGVAQKQPFDKEAVGVDELYQVLHQMDPYRPDWYPDQPHLATPLMALVARLSPQEVQVLIKIMLGTDLISEKSVIEAIRLSLEAEESLVDKIIARLKKCTPDLSLAAFYLLRYGVQRGLFMLGRIHYGIPIPMETMATLSIEEIETAITRLKTKRLFVQAKSDGVYVQIQKNGSSIHIFNEQGFDLASLVEKPTMSRRANIPWAERQRGMVAPRIDELIEMIDALPIGQIILDTEIVGINPQGTNVLKQADTFTGKHLQILVFDVIAKGSDDLRYQPYENRRNIGYEILGDLAPEYRHGIYMAEERICRDAIEITHQTHTFINQNRYEGAILKNGKSHLTSTLRWNFKRIKIKSYMTLDMLLVGCYYNMQSNPSKYLVALKDSDADIWYPCAIVTAQGKLQEMLKEHFELTATPHRPAFVMNDGAPDHWSNGSLVVEVETDGLRAKSVDPKFHLVEWTLNLSHQRLIVRIRDDKQPERSNTLAHLLALKLAPGHRGSENE